MFKRFALFLVGLLVCLCFLPQKASSQFTISGRGEVERAEFGAVCNFGSIYFDGRCRKRKFFKRLMPRRVTLLDVFGCVEVEPGQEEECGKTATLIERLNKVQTRTVFITSHAPIRRRGVGSRAGETQRITGRSYIQRATVPGMNTRVYEPPPTRGKYRVLIIETQTVGYEGESYELATTTQYYDEAGNHIASDNRDLAFTEPSEPTNAFDYAITGSVCTDPAIDLEQREGEPACSCIGEGNCLKQFKLSGGNTNSMSNGTEIACTEAGCSFCSSSLEQQRGGWRAAETNFNLAKIIETNEGTSITSNSGLTLTGLSRSWNGCWEVDGYYQGLLLSGENDDSTMCGPKISNLVGGTGGFCDTFAFKGAAALSLFASASGVSITPEGQVSAAGLELLTNPTRVKARSVVNGIEAADSWCGTMAGAQEITLETSFCEAKSNWGGCDGNHEDVIISFTDPETGRRCTGKTDLYCTSQSGSNVTLNSEDCSCTFANKVVTNVECKG